MCTDISDVSFVSALEAKIVFARIDKQWRFGKGYIMNVDYVMLYMLYMYNILHNI